ncbi:hypothetical protein [Catenulispora yoronensis]|uniref:hypothetical protein n=1 Tax=Catenulispora yoronensis TaxID=450799 RepID=UPI0031D8E33F
MDPAIVALPAHVPTKAAGSNVFETAGGVFTSGSDLTGGEGMLTFGLDAGDVEVVITRRGEGCETFGCDCGSDCGSGDGAGLSGVYPWFSAGVYWLPTYVVGGDEESEPVRACHHHGAVPAVATVMMMVITAPFTVFSLMAELALHSW